MKSIRVGLLSDTHIPDVAPALPGQLREVFRGVDLILHAGDLYSVSVLDGLESIAPVMACLGDDDNRDVGQDPRVKVTQTLRLDGLTLWLTHDRYSYWGAGPPPSYDILVSGHSHKAAVERRDGVLLVNPGSATFPDYETELGTVALLDVADGKAEVRLVQLR